MVTLPITIAQIFIISLLSITEILILCKYKLEETGDNQGRRETKTYELGVTPDKTQA